MTQKSYRTFVLITAAALLVLLFGEGLRHDLTAKAPTGRSSVKSRWYQYAFDSTSTDSTDSISSTSPDISSLRAMLRPHIKDRPFRYTRKHIYVEQGTTPDDPRLPALHDKFAPQWVQHTDLPHHPTEIDPFNHDTNNEVFLTLPTPTYPAHNPHICFGLATDIDRLRQNLLHMRHWMTHSGTSVLALIPPHRDAHRLQKNWRNMGIDITVLESNESFFDRLLRLIPAMKHLDASTKTTTQYTTEWFMIVDDDTFVPSVPRLASALAAYDHTRSFYIGGISEPKGDLSNIGMFAFGGAGMAFSSALVADLAPKIPECIRTATVGWGGDGRLAECVSRYSRTRLTYLRDLHQMDLVGDQSGVYESGFKPATLHHWRGWAEVPMGKVARVAEVTGEEALFQRWRFADGWVLTNGFSLVHYPNLGDGRGGKKGKGKGKGKGNGKGKGKNQRRQLSGPKAEPEWDGDVMLDQKDAQVDHGNNDGNKPPPANQKANQKANPNAPDNGNNPNPNDNKDPKSNDQQPPPNPQERPHSEVHPAEAPPGPPQNRPNPAAAPKNKKPQPPPPPPEGPKNKNKPPPKKPKKQYDFTRTEFTWTNGVAQEFEHSLGPFRPKLPAEEKVTWFFVDAVVVDETASGASQRAVGQNGAGRGAGKREDSQGGEKTLESFDGVSSDGEGRRRKSVRQIYLRRGDQNRIAEVVELVWER